MFVYKFRQWSKFVRELFFSRKPFFADRDKNRDNHKTLNPEKISATRYVSTCDVSGFFDSLLRD